MENIGILGIGTDIESIDRFREMKLSDNPFLNKAFTKNELDYCLSKENPAPHLAARYAGKEAVIKALNGAGKSNAGCEGIEILNNPDGTPIVRLHDNNPNKLKVLISLSHCEDKALAFAVVMQVSDNG